MKKYIIIAISAIAATLWAQTFIINQYGGSIIVAANYTTNTVPPIPPVTNTIYALTTSYKDVTNAIAVCPIGGTVIIPNGTSMWTATLSVSGISVIGSGSNSTSIIDGTPLVSGQIPLVAIQTATNLTRVSGFSVLSSNSSPVKFSGIFTIVGTNPLVRVDHINFYHNPGKPIQTLTQCYGLVDHCIFTMLASAGNAFECFGTGFGDDNWARPYSYGSSNAFYIENCVINCSPGALATIDVDNGAIIVFRYNTFNYGASFFVHGTDSGQRNRGGRTFEAYGNTFFYSTNQFDYFAAPNSLVVHAGSGIIYSNYFVNFRYFATMQSYRAVENSPNWQPWFGATGLSGYDSNSPALLSGFASATSNALYVASASWTVNQWFGCTVYNSNAVGGVNLCGIVTDNDAKTMHFAQLAPDAQWQMALVNGDAFVVHKAYPQIDQVGMGYGNLLSGSVPTPVWAQEHPAPVYCWSNNYIQYSGALLSGTANASSQYPNVLEGRDFTNAPMSGYIPFTYPHPLDN